MYRSLFGSSRYFVPMVFGSVFVVAVFILLCTVQGGTDSINVIPPLYASLLECTSLITGKRETPSEGRIIKDNVFLNSASSSASASVSSERNLLRSVPIASSETTTTTRNGAMKDSVQITKNLPHILTSTSVSSSTIVIDAAVLASSTLGRKDTLHPAVVVVAPPVPPVPSILRTVPSTVPSAVPSISSSSTSLPYSDRSLRLLTATTSSPSLLLPPSSSSTVSAIPFYERSDIYISTSLQFVSLPSIVINTNEYTYLKDDILVGLRQDISCYLQGWNRSYITIDRVRNDHNRQTITYTEDATMNKDDTPRTGNNNYTCGNNYSWSPPQRRQRIRLLATDTTSVRNQRSPEISANHVYSFTHSSSVTPLSHLRHPRYLLPSVTVGYAMYTIDIGIRIPLYTTNGQRTPYTLATVNDLHTRLLRYVTLLTYVNKGTNASVSTDTRNVTILVPFFLQTIHAFDASYGPENFTLHVVTVPVITENKYNPKATVTNYVLGYTIGQVVLAVMISIVIVSGILFLQLSIVRRIRLAHALHHNPLSSSIPAAYGNHGTENHGRSMFTGHGSMTGGGYKGRHGGSLPFSSSSSSPPRSSPPKPSRFFIRAMQIPSVTTPVPIKDYK